MPAKSSMPIYYINLDRSKDRRVNMEKQFKKFKTKATRIKAFDAAKDLSKVKIDKSWKCTFTTDTEYACTLSHLSAISRAYKNNDDVALIMEDDMKILRLPTNKLLSVAPADWDIIQLSASGISTSKLYKNPSKYFVPWHHFYINTGGYLINRRGMINLLYALAPQLLKSKDLDQITFHKTKLRWLPFPGTKACNADYVLYRLAKTYTCCDISMHEDRSYQSTIQGFGFFVRLQDRSAKIISDLFEQRGFLMSW